jgi:hypothetical protein
MSLPGSPEVTIAYNLTAATSVKIQIRDITGTLVKEQIFTPDPSRSYSGGNTGYNAVGINISDLPIGPYIVIVQPTGGAPTSGRFSVRR